MDDVEYQSGSIVRLSRADHQFKCIARRANPPATVEWKFNGDMVTEDTGVESTDAFNLNLFDYTSIVTRNVNDGLCGGDITCTAYNIATTGNPPAISVLAICK